MHHLLQRDFYDSFKWQAPVAISIVKAMEGIPEARLYLALFINQA